MARRQVLPGAPPIAKLRLKTRRSEVDLKPLVIRLDELLALRNLSKRRAAMQAGLDHQGILRIERGERPGMVACILLADFFEVNPNELLALAGWPVLKAFMVRGAENLPPDAVEVAMALGTIADPQERRRTANALMVLMRALKSNL